MQKTSINRQDGRGADALRPIEFVRHYTPHAEGSVLVKFGETHVLCTASIETRAPPFLKGTNKGWLTAEYGMLPRATQTRSTRAAKSGQSGRDQEIQRLIGRSLRAATDLNALAEHTITLDCDVIQADGGTRTAAISGAYVALHDALTHFVPNKKPPLYGMVSAVSVGICDGVPLLDLDYSEDSRAEVDMNVVMNELGNFIEVQGTAEGHAFQRDELTQMIDLAHKGAQEIIARQKQALEL